MLKLLKEKPANSTVKIPKIVVAWAPDSVGVTFYKRCLVLMTFLPQNLRDLIQNTGRATRGGGIAKKEVGWPHQLGDPQVETVDLYNQLCQKFTEKGK